MGSNGFDHVYIDKKTGNLIILESKLTTKSNNPTYGTSGGHKQGTKEYVNDVVQRMKESNQPMTKIAAQLIERKVSEGKVDFVIHHTKMEENGDFMVLGNTKFYKKEGPTRENFDMVS
ncbi:predicted protein [Naegleria gruberi]|uniref:Predicted protein n=1 Tax=Naegleria gruberi TaxID=5762 RepID=D2W3C0_NAEGR|nr:uncharacterized protein NAEGRDRAFT_75894 [Naegleria gruberi]EFC36489.1 predicted protein [Naegleria gruberi]|eukprot:XP_002669233.1 predicted protein [Naegleria gruberi strain NEG-M]